MHFHLSRNIVNPCYSREIKPYSQYLLFSKIRDTAIYSFISILNALRAPSSPVVE